LVTLVIKQIRGGLDDLVLSICVSSWCHTNHNIVY
jgi:hypothetical protein